MTTNKTMPRHFWMHEVVVAAVKGGAVAEWIHSHFDSRMVVWFNAGETIEGAVEMLLASLEGEKKEARHQPRPASLLVKCPDCGGEGRLLFGNSVWPRGCRDQKDEATLAATRMAMEAGPDLLASLKAIVERGGLHLHSNVSTEDLLRAHAAIAKAERAS